MPLSQFLTSAYGAGGAVAHSAQPNIMGQVVMLVAFIAIFWLLIWRPQSKRNKALKNLLGNLHEGDEVVTTGGIVGCITKVDQDFVVLKVSETVDLRFQKSSIVAALPKGTLKGME